MQALPAAAMLDVATRARAAVSVAELALSGHFWRDFLPVGPKSFLPDFVAASRFRLEHHLGKYNAVQRVFYCGALGLVALMLLSGLVADKRPWTVEQLHALPQVSQVTRHVCVEDWSMIGKWSDTPLKTFLERIGADTMRKYVGFECADGYYEGMGMPTALHPQTIMALRLSAEILPSTYGYPFKIRLPTKLGFKNPKFVTTIYVTNERLCGFWTDRGYNWFSGI
jgi:hypothetical protein